MGIINIFPSDVHEQVCHVRWARRVEELVVGKAADELMQKGFGRAVGVHAGPGDECGTCHCNSVWNRASR